MSTRKITFKGTRTFACGICSAEKAVESKDLPLLPVFPPGTLILVPHTLFFICQECDAKNTMNIDDLEDRVNVRAKLVGINKVNKKKTKKKILVKTRFGCRGVEVTAANDSTSVVKME
jgi:hypothetical protein